MAAQVGSGTRLRAASSDDDTTQRVMRAAITLFAERGFHGAGIRDIAAAAGLTTSTLYHYMSNKDDLLVEIMLATITPLRDASARIVDEIEDPATSLAAIVEMHVWAHASDPMVMLVADTELRALSGERLNKVMKVRDDYEGVWRSVIRAGVKQKVFEASQPELAVRALLQMTTGVSHWFSPSGKLRLEQLCHEYADWSLALLRAHQGKRALHYADLTLPKPDHYLRSEKS